MSQVGPLPETVVDAVSAGLLVTTADRRPIWSNRALRAILGGADPRTLPLAEVVPEAPSAEHGWSAPEHGPRRLDLSCRRVDDLLLYEITDVTERRRVHDRARSHAAHIEPFARIGTWVWDLVSGEITWSPALLRAVGLERFDFDTYRELLHPDDVEILFQTFDTARRTGEPFTITHRMYLSDRVTLRVFECTGEVITDSEGVPTRVLGTAYDVTELREVREELAYLAVHDPLTGLANRRTLTARLEDVLACGTAVGALILVDVDNFKDINDLRGYATGDEVMRELALRLPAHVPPEAMLGRLGGDEFAILLPGADVADALHTAGRLCTAIVDRPIVVDGEAVRVTLSAGVASLEGEPDCASVLAHADLALLEAKTAGRNRARLFSPEQYRHAVHRVNVLSRIRAALDTGRLQLDAQPIVTLATHRVSSYELLVRLRDGIYPQVGPADFLPTLERGDLVRDLDRWVIGEAVTALASSVELRLDVNVSSRSLEDPSFGEWVVNTLHRAGVTPVRLGLEITETTAISNLDAARRLATLLRAAGCRFSLDDFGAGFGSFVYLKHLPFTTVKIAGEFVRQADQGGVDRVLVDAVVRAARGLGMSTVAEYVDREPLIAALRDLGVDRGQGYHLGRPAPLTTLLAGQPLDNRPTQRMRRGLPAVPQPDA
ncbi:putative bifunctional diguanylate cyclase/phosphodiesterase [Virgisporangium aliadipatigenens]|uniref:putative bifunctional diguanylate cyclase/phosphodiesterase n=1 Tax=Virgisporangium aliadipatigenens TaxID=741659 RepID=UPI001941666D|nr:PAS domain-containing protein [Virgisporangium aliadipatigenens]